MGQEGLAEDSSVMALQLMQQALQALDGGHQYLEVKARLQEAIDAMLAASSPGHGGSAA